MMNKNRKIAGVALFIVMFALLLLSVIGLGMMYATNTETSINSNYKDDQSALYAALGGLQEMRDRIQPFRIYSGTSWAITPPKVLPSSTSTGVVYLINPKNGETVAPWDYTNKYADPELCKENILGLTGTTGIPCSGSSSLPTGSSWYTVSDDSQSAAGIWQNSNPLDFKWVRLTLKTNNMTAAAADGSSSDTNQVCWDGTHQVALPTGYGPECNRTGSVLNPISVTNSGAGYTAAPTVTIDASPAGAAGNASAHIDLATDMVLDSPASVTGVTVNTNGSGYTSVPTVTIDPPTVGGGTGMQATAHVCTTTAECGTDAFMPPYPISLSYGSAGTKCYAIGHPPLLTFTGGGTPTQAAQATATLAAGNGCVNSVTASGHCGASVKGSYSSVGFTSGGSGFTANVTFTSGYITAVTILSSGTGYTSGSSYRLTTCNVNLVVTTGARVNGASLNTNCPIDTTTYTTCGGAGYSSAPSVSFTPAVGTSDGGTTDTFPSATAALVNPAPTGFGTVLPNSIKVDNGGSGYIVGQPNVVISAPASGTQATATATAAPPGLGQATYHIKSIHLDNGGYGYTDDPHVTIGPPPSPPPAGSSSIQALASATLGRGTTYGKVYVITALAQTASGARSLMQMEAATPVSGFFATGALTVDGPVSAANINNMPNSQNWFVHGADANSCNDPTADPPHPAIGGYDDPNANPATASVTTITNSLSSNNINNVTGDGGTPSVENVYSSLGDTLGTPAGLNAMMTAIFQTKTNTGNTVNTGGAPNDLGTATNPVVDYVEGDLTLSGNNTGYGVLAVTGTLTMDGNFSWNGVVLIVGKGVFNFSGGGNGQINGTVLVANDWDSNLGNTNCSATIVNGPVTNTQYCLLGKLGSPNMNWNGGGGNGIQYDHCWVQRTMSKIPFSAPPSNRPLKILSIRSLS